jgi:hypothetical protein
MIPTPDLRAVIFRYAAKALGGTKPLGRMVLTATLSLADTLLTACRDGSISDVRRVKETLIRRTEAETTTKEADAQKRMAEAVEAANRASLHKRNDALAKAEKSLKQAKADKVRADAAKTEAEAKAILAEAATKRIAAMATFLDAVSKLRQAGGDLFVDRDELKRLLMLPPPGACADED